MVKRLKNKFYIVLFAILFTMMVSYGIFSVVPQTEYDCECYEMNCYETPSIKPATMRFKLRRSQNQNCFSLLH